MHSIQPPRFEHLKRLTDSIGLLGWAIGDCPDRFGGYRTSDNVEALRLCASAMEGADSQTWSTLALRYFNFALEAQAEDGAIRIHRDALGRWREEEDASLLVAQTARAMSAVVRSDLPVDQRMSASNALGQLMTQANHALKPLTLATWILSLTALPEAHPARDKKLLARLATRLMDDHYHAMRTESWEWFESSWTPGAATIPLALWHAADVLDDSSIREVAECTTRFLIDQFFEDGLFMPVGTLGGWDRHDDKAIFDQEPVEAATMTELLCDAESLTGNGYYGQFAEYACRWFYGNNVRGVNMIDAESGGCANAIRVSGTDSNQGAAALLAYLSAHHALAHRQPLHIEPTVFVTQGVR